MTHCDQGLVTHGYQRIVPHGSQLIGYTWKYINGWMKFNHGGSYLSMNFDKWWLSHNLEEAII
jgi:hypothetical protein